jgi:hypothetical protein
METGQFVLIITAMYNPQFPGCHKPKVDRCNQSFHVKIKTVSEAYKCVRGFCSEPAPYKEASSKAKLSYVLCGRLL